MRACLTERDRVAYAVPTYTLYRTLAALQGVQAVERGGRGRDVELHDATSGSMASLAAAEGSAS